MKGSAHRKAGEADIFDGSVLDTIIAVLLPKAAGNLK